MTRDRTSVYSICGMCTARCPIEVEVRDGRIKHIWGNPHSSLGSRRLCPRGAAGKAFEYDDERPQYPMLRDGERGSGNWKRISWDEALDRIAERLASIKQTHGPRAFVLSDRGGPHREFHRTFQNAYGSPNYFNHHATCSNSVHNAHMSIAGLPRNGVVYDYARCKHLLAFGRNFLESILTGEANQVVNLIERGAKFSYVDVRWNYTAAKATDFHMIRPHTDYSVAMGLIHVLLRDHIYNVEFVERWVNGLDDLRQAVKPFTPEFAESMAGFPAKRIISLAHELAEAAPNCIVYPGYMTAWGKIDYYLRRALYAINALLGTYEAPGGMIIAKGAGDAGIALRQLTSLAKSPDGERFDGIGTSVHHLGKQWGLAQALPQAILSERPYPIKAYMAMRHDPLASLPDPAEFKRGLSALDLVVSVDVNFSETGWFSDIILPEASYLERSDNIICRKGPKPKLALRRQAVEPRFDSKPRWWIFKELGKRLGLEASFPYESIEDHHEWQLEGTGLSPGDFDATGEVPLVRDAIMQDRNNGLKFKKRTGKLELSCGDIKQVGVACWAPCANPPRMAGNSFKVITGKVAVHTQGRTTLNNPLLNELVSENKVHIASSRAAELGIKTGDRVRMRNGPIEQIGVAKVSEFVSPDALFMLHGFGDTVPVRTRSHGKGVSDMRLYAGSLEVGAGGNCPMTDCAVTLERVDDPVAPVTAEDEA